LQLFAIRLQLIGGNSKSIGQSGGLAKKNEKLVKNIKNDFQLAKLDLQLFAIRLQLIGGNSKSIGQSGGGLHEVAPPQF